MASFNHVVLLGNLTSAPRLNYTRDNRPVAHFRMATNHRTQTGERPTYINVTCWGAQATTVALHKKKGDPVLVTGRLDNERRQSPDGGEREELIVTADRVQFLVGRRPSAPSSPRTTADARSDEVPF